MLKSRSTAPLLTVLAASFSSVDAWTTTIRTSPKTQIAMTNPQTNLIPILSQAIPTIHSYSHLNNIVQGNAEGTRILARHSSSVSEAESVLDENDSADIAFEETELFLKRVDAKAYLHKSWTDMRRTLVYLRTEVLFYKEFVPLLCEGRAELKDMVPICHHADYDLQGLIDDDSPATDVNAPPEVGESNLQESVEGKGGHILLQSLSNGYYQNSPISVQESLLCLRAVAELHASAMGNIPLLNQVSDRLSSAGGSYHLKFRNPKELQNIVSSWEAFRSSFVGLEDTKILEKESVIALGQRVFEMAEYVSDQLSPSVDDEYATLVHGDYKAMNVFLPEASKLGSASEGNNLSNEKAIMIDFSCVGIGYGMSDVAMHIVHAVVPADLEYGQEEYMVEQYRLALEDAVSKNRNDQWTFPLDVAMRQYQLACIDYLRFIMGRFWKSATPDTFEKKKSSKNTTLINRDVKAAMAFIAKVDRYLEMFEKEKTVSATCGNE